MKHNTFWKKKIVAVTGSSGFVGSAIVARLRSMDVTVIEISRRVGVDIGDFKALLKALRPANYIISAAAIDGNSAFKRSNSSIILEKNIQIVSSVLAAASRLKIHNLTIISSAAIYGDGESGLLSEDYDLIKHGDACQDGYTLSKRVAESLASEYQEKYGGIMLLPRPTNIYGGTDPHSRVIEAIAERVRTGKKIEIWGDGSQLRSFIYLDDFVSVLLSLIEKGVSGPINIAGSERTKVIDLAKMIGSCLNKKPMLTFVNKDMAQPDRLLDTTRLETLVCYNYTTLKDGLVKSLL